jgi:hypothetical protein
MFSDLPSRAQLASGQSVEAVPEISQDLLPSSAAHTIRAILVALDRRGKAWSARM